MKKKKMPAKKAPPVPRLPKAYIKAQDEFNIGKMRNIAANLPTEPKDVKAEAYRQIVITAIRLGDLDSAREAAVFCQSNLTREDYITCFNQARRSLNLRAMLACANMLGTRLPQSSIGFWLEFENTESPESLHSLLVDCCHGDSPFRRIMSLKKVLWRLSDLLTNPDLRRYCSVEIRLAEQFDWNSL